MNSKDTPAKSLNKFWLLGTTQEFFENNKKGSLGMDIDCPV